MSSHSRIDRAYKTARRITYNDDSKFIIFSDVHRGDNSFADDFASNRNIYFHALNHYFKNDFSDSYVLPSSLQEQGLQPEGTLSLAYGLNLFADANPEHPKANYFRAVAGALWCSMQHFVKDHGFLYVTKNMCECR